MSREIDKLIIEQVFGEETKQNEYNVWFDLDEDGEGELVPYFSTKEEDALELFKAVANMAASNNVESNLYRMKTKWSCTIGDVSSYEDDLCKAITLCVIEFFDLKSGSKNVNKKNNISWQ